MASTSASSNMGYDVFISFRGIDIRKTFLSHLLSKLDHKLIFAFKDYEMESSRSLGPELKLAIRNSRIAVVIFSKNYASSSWCLDELLEIVKCKQEFGQMVIPVFYDLEPTHVRKQRGMFGQVFQKTCENKAEKDTQLWRQALTDVANLLGYHSVQWPNEARMIGEIADDILDKLHASESSHNFVGIEYHLAKMRKLLELESEGVIMAGIWGSSGIGKTTIARTLFNQLSRHFQGSTFIDRGFVAKSMEKYFGANPDDYNMKLDLQRNFLSEILRKRDIEIHHLGVVGEKLQHQKVLIFIDDLYDKVVLDALVGQTLWFGSGSRIVVVTNDKHLLMAHGIDRIHEVGLPSAECALKIFCRYAFNQEYPPDGLSKFAEEVVQLAGSLPLGLNILGSSLTGKKSEDCLDLLPRFRRSLNGKIEKTLMFCYQRLDSEEDQQIFRHIACFFNHMKEKEIKLFLEDSELDVNVGLNNLLNKSLIHVREGRVEMQRLLQEMGRNIVHKQSVDEPGKREFLWRPNDICQVLGENTGTNKVIGISLNTSKIDDELQVHENAFRRIPNLRFLEIYSSKIWEEEVKLHLPESFYHLPSKLKLLSWSRYPLRCMPCKFCPKSLVKLSLPDSNLEKLWEGVPSLTCLVRMNLAYSRNLKQLPDLSMATNLEELDLKYCESLVELPSSIRNLNKLLRLTAQHCYKLESLPNGINLKSLNYLNLEYCKRLRVFPEISTNISRLLMCETTIEEFPSHLCLENLVLLDVENIYIYGDQVRKGMQVPLAPLRTMLVASSLTFLRLVNIPNLVELPSSLIQNLINLEKLYVTKCINLETLPSGINLKSLGFLDFSGCSRLRTFPDISTNLSCLYLSGTAIKEVPWWINKFSRLRVLRMKSCTKLKYVDLNISNTDRVVDKWDGQRVIISFTSCFNLDRVRLHSFSFWYMIVPGEEVPSYFTHRTSADSSTLTSVPLLHTSLSQPEDFTVIRVCAALSVSDKSYKGVHFNETFRFQGQHFSETYGGTRGREMYGFNHFKERRSGGCFCLFGATGKHEMNCLENAFMNSYDNALGVLKEDGSQLYIWDCYIPLSKRDVRLYHHVDIQLQVRARSQFTPKLKGWGIRILEDCSSAEIQLGCRQTEQGEDDTHRSSKRERLM